LLIGRDYTPAAQGSNHWGEFVELDETATSDPRNWLLLAPRRTSSSTTESERQDAKPDSGKWEKRACLTCGCTPQGRKAHKPERNCGRETKIDLHVHWQQ